MAASREYALLRTQHEGSDGETPLRPDQEESDGDANKLEVTQFNMQRRRQERRG